MLLISVPKTEKETNPQFAYRILKDNILNLILRPGEAISEIEISNILNISRTPIREALVHLKNESLIDVYPQKGTFVSLLDSNLIFEAEFMRTVLETEVIKLATKSFPKESLEALEKNLSLQKKIAEFSTSAFEFYKLDNEFHEIIFRACNKSNIWEQVKVIGSHLNRIRLLDAMERPLKITFEQHEKIFGIIKNHETEKAEEIVKEHISNFHTQLDSLHIKHPNFFKTLE